MNNAMELIRYSDIILSCFYSGADAHRIPNRVSRARLLCDRA